MTIVNVKHPNVLPQPAAASSGGVGGGISGSGSLTHGVGGGGNGRAGGIGGGRISPSSNGSSAFSKMRPSAKRCLFDTRPDPIDTKRICDESDKAERQRAIKRYEFDTYACRSVASSASASAAAGLHHRHHHQ
ncbi:WAS/WASL-interacting protein family member 1-like [Anopheles moucheti]|uniref:WAS/WASL-interacting protein family member 1-like n=1 Tax=Anopheles moucheti TaxID=186751 RepID=UPI0022F09538|nr:WAS/WASL-interacting protein family member 1-like [Anopheles moucheti]